jgi:glycosyltransferase involved in cell wall biosynthesis
VVVSRALADAARAADLKPRRIQVIYNGVDQNAFSIVPRGEARRRLGIADIGPTVGFVGNLKRSKGAVDAVHAYVLARRRIPTLQMLVVGRGDAEHEMREVAKLASPGGAVRFLGAQDHKSIATVMNAADVLILPSYAEGVPNVLLESQACGTPVVASRVGGVPEVVSEPLGRLVEPGNLQGFAEAIASTVAAPPERQLIRASVERFTWSRSANELAGTLLAAAASTARS